MPARKQVSYSYIVNQLDELGLEYHLVCDSWANGYTYHAYTVLALFHNVEPASEVIFDNLIDLLDEHFFKLY